MAASYRYVVSGRVQGVFFRQSAAKRARDLGLAGWIRNREDCCVEGVVAGEDAALEAFKAWLHRGPPAARVERVEWLDAGEATLGGEFAVRP